MPNDFRLSRTNAERSFIATEIPERVHTTIIYKRILPSTLANGHPLRQLMKIFP